MGLIFFMHRFKIPMFAVSNQTLQDHPASFVIVFINRADRPRETKVCPLPQLFLDLLKDSSCLRWSLSQCPCSKLRLKVVLGETLCSCPQTSEELCLP